MSRLITIKQLKEGIQEWWYIHKMQRIIFRAVESGSVRDIREVARVLRELEGTGYNWVELADILDERAEIYVMQRIFE